MAIRSGKKLKGVNKLTFGEYYELPGIICERLFSVLDKNQDNYIDLNEFTIGMMNLFSEDYSKLTHFIFDLFDFDKDGQICREDIRIVYSYLPLKTERNSNGKLIKGDYKDRIESQNEIFYLLGKVFGGMGAINYEKFLLAIENISSELFLFVLFFN